MTALLAVIRLVVLQSPAIAFPAQQPLGPSRHGNDMFRAAWTPAVMAQRGDLQLAAFPAPDLRGPWPEFGLHQRLPSAPGGQPVEPFSQRLPQRVHLLDDRAAVAGQLAVDVDPQLAAVQLGVVGDAAGNTPLAL